jgi:NADH-quinone oxidoreductase subunit L
VIHALSGEQDIQNMGGLRKAMPVTAWTFIFATLAISGFPPFSGFFSKDEILWETFQRGHTVLGVLGMVTAALTAFYMWRLCALTFFGKSRVAASSKSHLHESSWTMTSVLSLLALLSLVGGAVGIPHIFGGHPYLREWLALPGERLPSSGNEHGELLLLVLSVAVALAAAMAALVIYLRHSQAPSRWAARLHGLYRILLNKYYVDEIYDATVVRPLRRGSETILSQVIDEGVIDGGMVNGSGRLAAWTGSLVSRLQGGLVNRYAFYFLASIAFFTLWLVIF